MIELSQRTSCFPHQLFTRHRTHIALGGGLTAVLPPGDLPPRQRWDESARRVMNELDRLDIEHDGCLEHRPTRILDASGVEVRIWQDEFPVTALLTHPMLIRELDFCLRRILGHPAAIWIRQRESAKPRLRALPLAVATALSDGSRNAVSKETLSHDGWEGAFDIQSGFLQRITVPQR